MAVDKGDPRGVNLHKKHDAAFVPGVAFKPSLDIMPLKIMNSLKYSFGAEQERRNPNKIVTGTELKSFICHGEMPIDLGVVETVQNSFGPVTEDILVVAEEDVVAVEFDDLL